ncbi:MAG: hypothetical protein ABIU05_08885 [Nitrospirales bacterium]
MNIPHRCHDVTVAAREICSYTSPLFRRANEGTTVPSASPVSATVRPIAAAAGHPPAATPDLVFSSILRVDGARQLASKDVR